MTISTAEVLEKSAALSEFTAASDQPVSIERAVTANRRVRVDWYALGVILLILASGAVCLYRLAWAMQP